jgi:hypothetical protein
MIESKVFSGGGLNQDTDNNFLRPNDWKDALNIRVTDRLNSSESIVSNIKGNTSVTYALPAGTNKTIGSYANEQTGKYYSFIWNSNGEHSITEFDPTSNTIVKVLQASYLNFQEYALINGVGIVDKNLLYWTDGFNPPRYIDIVRAKTGTYYTDSISISLAKAPPLKPINPSYSNDPNPSGVALNRLKNQLFQFKYLFVYENGERSTWSTNSIVAYPSLETNQSIGSESFRNNNIILSLDAGNKFVKTIEIAAQVKGVAVNNTQDWFSILTIDRADVLTSSNYDSSTNTYIYRFFNDGLYQSIDIVESDLSYDFIPLKSKALDIINGNVLSLANNTEGYDNIIISSSIDITYTENSETDRLSTNTGTGVTFILSGTPVVGDIIDYTVTYTAIGGEVGDTAGSFTVNSSQSGNLLLTAYGFAGEVQSSTSDAVLANITTLPSGDVEVEFFSAVEGGFVTILIAIILSESALTLSVPVYKTNSKYQFGLVYYDEFNRSSYVQTNNSLIASTKSFGNVTGFKANINWEINHLPPSWAKKYQWVRTEQLTHSKFLFWIGTEIKEVAGKDYYEVVMNTYSAYDEKNPNSILSYDYSAGDRFTLHKKGATWISGIDVEVVGFEVTDTTAVLRIQKNAGIALALDSYLFEIYTPKTRSNSLIEQFFYEFGEVYDIVNGFHQGGTQTQTSSLPAKGVFINGDVFTRERVVGLASSALIEDPNFSDFYVSNFSSNGRVNIFSPQAKQLNLPTDIRYSDTYVPNTNINGLNRFYGDAFESYDRVNGSIQKTAVRDNYLIVFQELKTGYVPIFQSIIEDQGSGNNANVAISNKLLNKIRYYVGDFGIGLHPESMARFGGLMYFVDPNRGQVIKLSGGLQPISVVGMDSYFTSKLTAIKSSPNVKVLGSYDPYNDEYIISFKITTASNAGDSTLAFSEQINRWTSFYSFIPDFGGYIFNQYITHKSGVLYTHNNNDTHGSFYGVNYDSFIDVVFNSSPNLVKTFIGIMEQANVKWIPVDIDTSNGQVSSLIADDIYRKEDVYLASFLRDTSSPGGLLSGDDLKGNWIRLKLLESNTVKSTLFSVMVRAIPSYQGIK